MDQIGKGILRKRLTRIAARTNPYFDSIERPRGFNNRDLKQTTTATARRTWKNKRSNCMNNSAARAL